MSSCPHLRTGFCDWLRRVPQSLAMGAVTSRMTFFIASAERGKGKNPDGLAGGNAPCQALTKAEMGMVELRAMPWKPESSST